MYIQYYEYLLKSDSRKDVSIASIHRNRFVSHDPVQPPKHAVTSARPPMQEKETEGGRGREGGAGPLMMRGMLRSGRNEMGRWRGPLRGWGGVAGGTRQIGGTVQAS